jgi:putative copper resistance protein D
VLHSWSFSPVVVLGLAAVAAAYLRGVAWARQRHSASPFPRLNITCFMSGLGVTYLALQSPIKAYSDRLLSVHMVQHLLLTMAAAPLLVLGAPVILALRASSRSIRERVVLPLVHSALARFLSHPGVSWGAFVAAMWATHFTNLYQEALGSETIHNLEHILYLATALLFWRPILGVDAGPSRISHPARFLYVFLSMPPMAFLGLAIYSSNQVLYTHYLTTAPALGTSALADQHLAGALMWITPMVLFLPALAFVLFDWMKKETREGIREDARLDRMASAGGATVPRADQGQG